MKTNIFWAIIDEKFHNLTRSLRKLVLPIQIPDPLAKDADSQSECEATKAVVEKLTE